MNSTDSPDELSTPELPASTPVSHDEVQASTDKQGTANGENSVIDLFPEVTVFRKRSRSNFVFMYNNINSYRHKHISIKEMLSNGLIDFIAIAESKLDSSFPTAQFRIQNFEIYRQDFTSNSGGILIHLREDIPQRRIEYAEVTCDGFESICIEVTLGGTKSVITSFYKHPHVKHELFKLCFSKVIDNLLRIYDDLIFLADANCCPTKSSTIQDICDTYGLKNLIKSPTCHKSQNSTLLDVLLVNNPKRYIDSLNAPFCLSDFHNIIGAATRRFAPVRKPFVLQYRSYKHFNDADFLYDMSSAPFHVAEIFDDVNDMAWYTNALISTITDSHAPTKTKILKHKPVPYMNSELRKTMYARNMARNKHRKFGIDH